MLDCFAKMSQTPHIKDFVFILCITIPVFLFYVVFTCYYFIKKDPYIKKDGGGLSRFLLAGIFVMFGLILFDLIMECYSAYAVQFLLNDNGKFQEAIGRSLILINMCKAYRPVPINILINGTIFCIALYTGTEGIIAGMKTLKVEQGLAVELPPIKRTRLSVIFLIWCYLSVVATLYHFLIGSETVEFDILNFYIGLIVNFAILFLAERTPSTLEDVSVSRTVKVKDDGKVVGYESDNPVSLMDENIEKTLSGFVAGDHISEVDAEKLNEIFGMNKDQITVQAAVGER